MKRLAYSLLTLQLLSPYALSQQSASASFAPPQNHAGASASAVFGPAPDPRCQLPAEPPCAAKPKKPVPKAKQLQSRVTRDPMLIHREVAVKDTKPPKIAIPGVMDIDGADPHALDMTRARVIDVTNGGAQTVYLSAVDQNRIQLPWLNTKAVGTKEITINKSPHSNNVYVQFEPGVTRGVSVSFEHPEGSSVIDLKLEPKKDLTGQVILIRDFTRRSGDRKREKGTDYVGATQSLMEQVALGGPPQGYSQSELSVGPIAMNGVVITPRKVYSSADKDIYVYDVVNPGPNKASLQEKEFDGENVVAVSIFPKPVLAVNERTMVIVMTRKATGG